LGVKNKSKKGYIKIFVSDSGQGIKENNLKRINKQIEEIVNF
jgi:sensor histidine kinase YesM